MQSIRLLDIASQHSQWLSTRQALIAGNVANANTPGYKALDVAPFAKVMETMGLQMAADQPGHLRPDSNGLHGLSGVGRAATWDVYYSGNDVSLEQELLKSGEVNRAYSLNTSIVKTFHNMLISSAKGG